MKYLPLILFAAIFTIAAAFRFVGLHWDANAHLHPDERFLTMVTTDISWPKTITEFFSTQTSPANPHNAGHSFYVYGTYPVHFTKFIAGLLNRDAYDGIPTVGRSMSGIADLLTMIFVFLITKELMKHQASRFGASPYIAMAIYGAMVLPIQLSHFYTVDPYATLFCTIALYLLFRNRIGLPLGIAVGLAISAKISSILLLPIIGLAIIKAWPWSSKGLALKHAASIVWFTIALLITIRVFYPYLFDGWMLNQQVLDNWKQLKAFDGSDTSFPPALQWIGVPFWKPTVDMILHGLGLPLGILALVSILHQGLRIRNQKENRATLILLWILIVAGYQSLQFAKAMRYFYPIYPALAVLTTQLLSRIQNRYLVTLLLSISLIWPIAFVSIYTRPHTRVAASDWIYTNIPKGATLAWEHWDDPLPLSRNAHHIGLYDTIQLPMYDPDTETKWKRLTDNLANTDYIILSSNRVYGGVAHARERYPYTNRYYQLLFSGELGFEIVSEFTTRPTILGIQLNDDNAEESFTVYDHPKVVIFKKNTRYTAQQIYDTIILRLQ